MYGGLLGTTSKQSVSASTDEQKAVTPDPRLTGDPQKDWEFDPNLPRELRGFNMSHYPFFSRVPARMKFDCTDRIDGFYANVDYQCQVYHHCLYGIRQDFLCGNYTAFDMRTFICQFINVVDCKNSDSYTYRNEPLYKATTTVKPERRPFNKVSEDYDDSYDYYDYYYDEYSDQSDEKVPTTTSTTTTTTAHPTSTTERLRPLRWRPGSRPRRPQASRRGQSSRRRPRPQEVEPARSAHVDSSRDSNVRDEAVSEHRVRHRPFYDYYYDDYSSAVQTDSSRSQTDPDNGVDRIRSVASKNQDTLSIKSRDTFTSRRRPGTINQPLTRPRPNSFQSNNDQRQSSQGTAVRAQTQLGLSFRRNPFDNLSGYNEQQKSVVRGSIVQNMKSTQQSAQTPLRQPFDYDYYDYLDDSSEQIATKQISHRGRTGSTSTAGSLNLSAGRPKSRLRPPANDHLQFEDSRSNEVNASNDRRPTSNQRTAQTVERTRLPAHQQQQQYRQQQQQFRRRVRPQQWLQYDDYHYYDDSANGGAKEQRANSARGNTRSGRFSDTQ